MRSKTGCRPRKNPLNNLGIDGIMLVMNIDESEITEQPPIDNDHVAEGATPFTDEEIAANALNVGTQVNYASVEPIAPESILAHPVESLPPSASDIILGIEADGEFLKWAVNETVSFLDFADLDRVATVNALRGSSEAKIADKIQIANSVLVLIANYGSQKDDHNLVTSCNIYADKMKTIIKRLCL